MLKWDSANMELQFWCGCAGCGTFAPNLGTSDNFPATSTPRSQNATQSCSYNTWGGQLKFSVYSTVLTKGLHFRLLIANTGGTWANRLLLRGSGWLLGDFGVFGLFPALVFELFGVSLTKLSPFAASFDCWRVPFVAFWLCWGGLLGCSCTQMLPHTSIRPP